MDKIQQAIIYNARVNEKELKGITDLIAECEKLNIKPLISEDESVPIKKEV